LAKRAAARVAAEARGGTPVELRFATPAPDLATGGWWIVELRSPDGASPFRGGAAGDNAHGRGKKARNQRTPKGLRTRPTVPHANKCMGDGNGSAARASVPATVKRLPRRAPVR
jgi:hypothetical protein